MRTSHNKRLAALEAACEARPSRDVGAAQFAADLANVYGEPGDPVQPMIMAEWQADINEVYGHEND